MEPSNPTMSELASKRQKLARSLMLDARAAQALCHLETNGIAALLLKGPSIAEWLYSDGTLRTYADVDILVAPRDWDRAADALQELGFQRRRRLAGAHWSEFVENEQLLVDLEGTPVDLHRWLVGVPASLGEKAWQVLESTTTTIDVGGRRVRVLGEPARAVHLALHAAQNGVSGSKSMADLERGLTLLPQDLWQEAAEVAKAIGASAAFAAGLRLTSAGQSLAAQLALPEVVSAEQSLRLVSAPEYAQSFARKLDMRSGGSLASSVFRELWPSKAAVRAWHPQAGSGGVQLLLWRLRRPFWVAAHLPSALRWLWRARAARRLSPPPGR